MKSEMSLNKKLKKGMKILKFTAFLFTILLFFSSCYKDNNMFIPIEEEMEPDPEPKGDIADFFSNSASQMDSIRFAAESGIRILTANETVLEIFPNSFQNGNGDLASGEIEFTYIEVLQASEYAFYNLPTISGGQRLRSEGVFRFEAYSEGEKLQFKEGKGILVRLPDDAPEVGMQLFVGEGQGEEFDWIVADETINVGINSEIEIGEWSLDLEAAGQDFVQGFGYLFTCDLFTWINVDIFADVPESQKTEVCVELPELYTPENTVVFMYFNGENSILGLFPDADKMKWCEPYGATPIDYTVTFLVVSNQGEDVYHFGIQEIVVTEEATVFIEPEELSLDDILKKIKELE